MKRMLVAFGVLGFVCAAAQAQEAKPGPELKKLDVWLGEWSYEVEVKESPSGTERRVTGTIQGQRLG